MPSEQRRTGVLAALLETNFNAMVTPSIVKTIYVLTLIVVSLECLAILLFGVWLFQGGAWLSGLITVLCTPFVWLLQMLVTRVLMEAVVVRFKQAEYLRVIKDKL
ncbi:DUF4282 domain-containing protein [Actinomadura syzygii]|uniref:DUF4282 domain-containing protein n=1 Tax=Actinomadura syzygii TaxID=1427538 RepID=A0A5D0U6E4_9ACTN|nr:DUF4282 domain-containing protein [Actinomadura syzygii]TYC13667.1 DUF4282 domain-containing protein [Actinomadura syzygii]